VNASGHLIIMTHFANRRIKNTSHSATDQDCTKLNNAPLQSTHVDIIVISFPIRLSKHPKIQVSPTSSFQDSFWGWGNLPPTLRTCGQSDTSHTQTYNLLESPE